MKFQIEQVRYATLRAHERKDLVVFRALSFLEDSKKKERLEACECPACFYLDGARMAGQAFTEWTCQACEQEQPMWPNTAYPKLCLPCAKKYNLCIECLADLDLRTRHKLTRRKPPSRRR